MNAFKATMQQAIVGMKVQTQRLGLASENVSNADTPGYRRKLLVIATEGVDPAGQPQSRITLDPTPGSLTYSPSHPMADENGYVVSSNVSLVTEMADMREANRGYEANLNSFQQARSMYGSLLDLLRR